MPHAPKPRAPRLHRAVAIAVVTLVATLLTAAHAAAADVTVTSFDGTKIVAHWFPAQGLAAGERAATVLRGPGWSQPGDSDAASADSPEVGSVGNKTLADEGYNVLTWDPRGFGRSGGTVQVDSKDFEGRDVQALLDWLATQPEAKLDRAGDPRVGMVGASYGGGIQLVTAAIDKRVDAIVPSIAWHSLTTALYKQDTVKLGWASLLGLLGSALGRLDSHITSAIAEGTATGRLSAGNEAWFTDRGPAALVDRIKIPTLLIQGTVDDLFTLDEATTNYRILRGNGVPTKLLWFCGGHGICLTPTGDTTRIHDATVNWLHRYLDRQTSVKTGARFDWVDQDGRDRQASDYPLPAGPAITASGSGTLLLTDVGGSGPPIPSTPPTSAIPLAGLPVAPAKALNAVNVKVPTGAGGQVVAGPPTVTLAYKGTATRADSRVYAQLVDDATGRVLGNQITPIPVTLDGKARTVSQPLEIVSATTHAGSSFTLQLVASSVAYGPARALGSVAFSQIKVSVPTAKP